MGKFGSNLAGAAGLTVALLSSTAYAVPANGTFTFTPGNGGIATLTPAGNITAGTTAKSVVSPGTTSASSGNLGIAAGSAATITPTTISILSGAINVAISAGGFTFTFTSQSLNQLTPTVVGTPGSTGFIGDTLSGTITAAPAGFDLSTPVVDSQSCSQPVISGVAGAVGCSDVVVVGTVTMTTTTTSVPEPASLALLGTALVGFGLARRRRKAA